jgi:hypothetical protein
MSYDLIGKTVLVHLYDHAGRVLGAVTGRVADVSYDVEVAPGMTKDLAYVVDIETGATDEEGEPVPYENSAGGENESWFALQDLEIVEEDQPRFFAN